MGLQELVEISRYYGRDPDFVVLGGGNTSYKEDDLLHIKASGTTLADISEDGLVPLRRERLDAVWRRIYSDDPAVREAQVLKDLMEARVEGETRRPSVESLLHELLRGRYVVHTHPSLVNGLACGRSGEAAAAEIFAGQALWVPTTNPGYVLAALVRRLIAERLAGKESYPSILILQNHGIFVAADTTLEIEKIYTAGIAALRSRIGRVPVLKGGGAPDPVLGGRLALALQEASGTEEEAPGRPGAPPVPAGGSPTDAPLPEALLNPEIMGYVANRRAFADIESFGYTPDHIVYCLSEPAWVEYRAEEREQADAVRTAVERFRSTHGSAPRIVAVERRGVLVRGENQATLSGAKALFLDLLKVVAYSDTFGGPQLMPDDQIDFIRNWEVEKYRARKSVGASV